MLEKVGLYKTSAAIDIIVTDCKKIRKTADIVFPLVMIAYYVYAVITHLADKYLFIINSILLGLLSVNYLVDMILLSREKNNKKIRKRTSRVFKYLIHLVKILSAVYAVYEIVALDKTVIKTLLTLVAVGCVIIQVLVDIVTLIIEHYATIIYAGFEMDIEEFNNSAIGKVVDAVNHPRSKFLELVDKPLGALAKRKKKPEELLEPKVEETKDYKNKKLLAERAELLKEKNKVKKVEKKANKKLKKKERYEIAESNVKEHLSTIFSKKTQSK